MHLNLADRVAGKTMTPSQPSSTSTLPPAITANKVSSLARAFTTSAKSKDKDLTPMGRSATQRAPVRPQISLPVALISTTNMLSYDAPDLMHAPLRKQQEMQQQYQVSGVAPTRKASTTSSATSDSSSARSRHSNASHTTAATSLSVEGFSPDSPSQNHLSCYFKQNVAQQPDCPPALPPQSRLSGSTHFTGRQGDSPLSNQGYNASPQVPSRATSHSMKAHVLSHKLSVSRVGMVPQAKSNQHDSLASRGSSDASPPYSTIKNSASPHPFGKELEQLNEIAEEFSSTVRDAEQLADLSVLQSKGLGNFCATEYMAEIAPLFHRTYAEDLAASTPAWI